MNAEFRHTTWCRINQYAPEAYHVGQANCSCRCHRRPKLLDAAGFADAMQAESERHNATMQSIIDREDPEARWERVHNPTHEPTSCQHARLVHTADGCTRCACLFMPNGRAR